MSVKEIAIKVPRRKILNAGLAAAGLAVTGCIEPVAEAIAPQQEATSTKIFKGVIVSTNTPENTVVEVASTGESIYPERGTTPLAQMKTEVSTSVHIVDFDLTKRDRHFYQAQEEISIDALANQKHVPRSVVYKAALESESLEEGDNILPAGAILDIGVGNWFDEGKGTAFELLGKDIPVYDCTDAKNKYELYKHLDGVDSATGGEESKGELRKIELIAAESVLREFDQEGQSYIGWSNRHVGFLNYLLERNGLDLRISLGRIALADDAVALEVARDRGIRIPSEGFYNRWAVADDPREYEDFYNEKNNMSYRELHELGHDAMGMPDLYFANERGGQTVVVGGEEAKIPELEYPADWLMVLQGDEQSAETPHLSPFTIEAIKVLDEKGFTTWNNTREYWESEAFNEISDDSAARFVSENEQPLVNKRTSMFVSKFDQHGNRVFEKNPDFVADTDEEGRVKLQADQIKGYPTFGKSSVNILRMPKNFVFFVEDDEGELSGAHLSSYDFLLATWEAGDRPPMLDVKIS